MPVKCPWYRCRWLAVKEQGREVFEVLNRGRGDLGQRTDGRTDIAEDDGLSDFADGESTREADDQRGANAALVEEALAGARGLIVGRRRFP